MPTSLVREMQIKTISHLPGWQKLKGQILSGVYTGMRQYSYSHRLGKGEPMEPVQRGLALPGNFELSDSEVQFLDRFLERTLARVHQEPYVRMVTITNNCLLTKTELTSVTCTKPEDSHKHTVSRRASTKCGEWRCGGARGRGRTRGTECVIPASPGVRGERNYGVSHPYSKHF